MSDKTINTLIKKYPKLFIPDRNKYPVIYYGLECGEGWFDLIDTLCGSIQHYIDSNERTNKYIIENNKKNPEKAKQLLPTRQVVVHQIKEKFGGLRFYVNHQNEYVSGLIAGITSMSYKTCEYCGAPGKLSNTTNWYVTGCKKHRRFVNRKFNKGRKKNEEIY